MAKVLTILSVLAKSQSLSYMLVSKGDVSIAS